MLIFNPFLWISIDECLEHPYFSDLEVDRDEVQPTLDADHLKLAFDDCSEPELRKLLEDTFDYYNKNRKKNYGI